MEMMAVLLFIIALATAVLALLVPDILSSVALLASYSLFIALLFTVMAAVDVALVEVALGAGLTGVVFVLAVYCTTRRQRGPRGQSIRLTLVIPLIIAGLALTFWGTVGLPSIGDPDAPVHHHVSARYLEQSWPQTRTPNVVTAVLADFRSMDTFGETMVIITAALAAFLVLRREPDSETHR